MRVCLAVLAMFVLLGMGQEAVAQAGGDPSAQNTENGKRKRGKKKDEILKRAAKSMAPTLFPDWGTPRFDWGLGPIVGLKYTSVSDETGRTDTATTELGLHGGLSGIPVSPGNPGVYTGVSAGGAKGTVVTSKTADDVKVDNVTYSRYFGQLSLTVPYRFYKHTLSLGAGLKTFDDDELGNVRSVSISNDFGLLILRWLSGHYTHTYLVAYDKAFSEPFLDEQDSWWHGRMFFDFMDFYLDIGPGLTFTQVYRQDPHEKIAEGQTDYFKLLTAAHLFWKLGLSGQAKYVFRSTEEALGAYAEVDLPSQSVNEPRMLTMPEDSLTGSFFLGLSNLFGGVGFGWVYNVQMLNLSEKDGAKTVITRDQGLRITYTANY